MALVKIGQKEKNLPDSLADNTYQSFGSGSGDRRFNIPGNWEVDHHVYDFYLNDVEFYFFTRSDLLDYIHSLSEELNYPTQEYSKFPKNDIKGFYERKIQEIMQMPEITTLHFVESSRSGGTAYIANDNEVDGAIYNKFREICLSSSRQGPNNAYTNYRFVKYKDTESGKCYINLIPIFSKKYNMEELANILKRGFDAQGDWHTFIYVFGMRYAEQIISQNINVSSLVNNATIDISGVAQELDNAISLYKYLKENKISINPIDDKIEILGAYLRNQENVNVQLTTAINHKFRQFITAIKSKPFLLLAGISGTGKSRIVRELARACWEPGSDEFKAQKPSNFEMVQVKPNWHDSSELIGYVSRIGADKDGNPRPEFVAGEFLRFIAKAWENPDIPYFLCLDEMNLAPVEQYFAEYLSVIESRKADGNGNVITDPILKSDDQWYFDLTAKLTQDDEVRTRFNTDGITIPQNLIVVGTVNMDETTFSFSRKVLDRAMTIEMNKVDLMNNLHKDQKFENIGILSEEDLIGTAVEGVDVYDDNQAVSNMVLNYLQAINNKLEGKPFKIAYRTRNEFLLYVVNNLPYTQDEAGEDLSTEFVIARALDEITSMKVLSRIEGDESKVSKSFLEELKKVIKEQLEKIAGDVTFVAKVKENDTEDDSNMQHLSISLAKLDEMIKRLDSGYTSFWS